MPDPESSKLIAFACAEVFAHFPTTCLLVGGLADPDGSWPTQFPIANFSVSDLFIMKKLPFYCKKMHFNNILYNIYIEK